MEKHKLLTICLLVLVAFLSCNACMKNRNKVLETFDADSMTEEEITEELVVALFIGEITNEVTDFYSEYYSGEVEVYNYEVAIVDIGKREPGIISVKFGVTPQIGAHNPIGYDELVYHVHSNGDKKLAGYEHLKDFEVPEKFQEYIIKPD